MHLVIAARSDAINDSYAGPDNRIGADARFGIDAVRLLQEPDTHLETKIRARERAHRTDIDCVERVIVRERLSRIAGERRVAAAIDEPEDIIVHDFLAKPDAARAEDTALVIERHARAQLRALRL